FGEVSPETYSVLQSVPAIYTPFRAFAGPAGAVAVNLTTIQVTVTGNVSGNNNFLDVASVVSASVGTISGSVINQATGVGIPGVTILLLTQLNNTFVGATTTDINGAYTFTNEPPGSYLVVQSVPNGFLPVSLTTLTVTVVAGANQGNINFLDSSVGPPAGTNT